MLGAPPRGLITADVTAGEQVFDAVGCDSATSHECWPPARIRSPRSSNKIYSPVLRFPAARHGRARRRHRAGGSERPRDAHGAAVGAARSSRRSCTTAVRTTSMMRSGARRAGAHVAPGLSGARRAGAGEADGLPQLAVAVTKFTTADLPPGQTWKPSAGRQRTNWAAAALRLGGVDAIEGQRNIEFRLKSVVGSFVRLSRSEP